MAEVLRITGFRTWGDFMAYAEEHPYDAALTLKSIERWHEKRHQGMNRHG